MDLHQIEQITKVLSEIHSAEAKVVYIIGALIAFLVLTTCVWLCDSGEYVTVALLLCDYENVSVCDSGEYVSMR